MPLEGSGGDPQNHGQNLNSRLGKIMRIDVTTLPFTPMGNYPGALPEIWHIGMRNPWRLSFDACTGDLYIGDVGQDQREEIDFAPALQGHKNFGWRLKEGTLCYNPASNCDPGAITGICRATASAYDWPEKARNSSQAARPWAKSAGGTMVLQSW